MLAVTNDGKMKKKRKDWWPRAKAGLKKLQI